MLQAFLPHPLHPGGGAKGNQKCQHGTSGGVNMEGGMVYLVTKIP